MSPTRTTAVLWHRLAIDSSGRVDILVNNAGVGTAVPATRETPEQFRSVIDLNLNGCSWLAQACVAHMKPSSYVTGSTLPVEGGLLTS